MLKKSLFIFTLLMLSQSAAHATLISVSSAFGEDKLTLDENTGLSWINIDLTLGLAPIDALNAMQAIDGRVRYATFSELGELMSHVGLTSPVLDVEYGNVYSYDDPGYAEVAASKQFSNLLDSRINSFSEFVEYAGPTAYIMNAAMTFDIFDMHYTQYRYIDAPYDIEGGDTRYAVYSYNLDEKTGLSDGNQPNNNIATFLVLDATPVDEPISVAIFFFAAMFMNRRLSHRRIAQ